MNKYFFIIIFTLFVSCNRIKIQYPETIKTDQVDHYFGAEVHDPYRWLEDNDSEATKAWVGKQNETTFNYLSRILFRDKVKKRLEELSNYKKVTVPQKEGGFYFYYKNEGLQNQSVLYMQENLDAVPVVAVDPNNLSENGTASVDDFGVSKNGELMAYSVGRAGSDWREIYVKNLKTGVQLGDNLKWLKFSEISWYKNGFFYSRYKEPEKDQELSGMNEYQKVYYHRIGQKQEDDKLIYENVRFPLHYFQTEVTADEKYLIIYEAESTFGCSVFIKNLSGRKEDIVQLTTGFEYDYKVVGNQGNDLFVLTNYKAPKYKLIKIDVNVYDVGNWKDMISEKKEVLSDCYFVGGRLFAHYTQDAHSKVEIYDIKGNYESELILPTLGTLENFYGSRDDSTAFYSFTSFTFPDVVYKYNINQNTSDIFFQPKVNFDFDKYITRQVFYESKDGTRIPMFIVHKKDLVLNGNNPTLLYGYGGFNASFTPSFEESRLLWLENNGIYALANIRGGGEYGEMWHQAGMRLNKQNVFDDFIGAAEYLIREKYTNPKKMAIQGVSNGGLLIGAVINQRPDLFKVALPAVGVMDMLRFHKFTIGWAWVKEFGYSEDSVEFINLYSYSPLHNIKGEVEYPAVFVTTGDHDDRVVPAHSYKYIATLQEKYKGKNPLLIRIQTDAGHGSGKPVTIKIEEETDIYTFTMYNLGISPKNKRGNKD